MNSVVIMLSIHVGSILIYLYEKSFRRLYFVEKKLKAVSYLYNNELEQTEMESDTGLLASRNRYHK